MSLHRSKCDGVRNILREIDNISNNKCYPCKYGKDGRQGPWLLMQMEWSGKASEGSSNQANIKRDTEAGHVDTWGKCVLGRKHSSTKKEVCLSAVLLKSSYPEE